MMCDKALLKACNLPTEICAKKRLYKRAAPRRAEKATTPPIIRGAKLISPLTFKLDAAPELVAARDAEADAVEPVEDARDAVEVAEPEPAEAVISN